MAARSARPAEPNAEAADAGYAEEVADRPGRGGRDAGERGLRGLVGAGPSQVGVSGAMRTRDAARPRDQDIAAAERELLIVRRHYVPTDGRSAGGAPAGGDSSRDS